MVNFDLLAAKIGSGVWGTPATFNCFRVLAAVSYTHLRAHETPEHLVCRLLLEKKKKEEEEEQTTA